ncbi:MAG TPA: glycosyltransferase family 4 protein [Solirubrobacteraceae bacterium]|nr:glycosyltransferase family 4 protein [Solirubrobacteraceae bacterium]
MKVLFVAAHPPLPLDNGGRLRTFHLLDELSQRAEVVLATLEREPGDDAGPGADELAEAIPLALPRLLDVAVVPAPASRKRLRQLGTLAGGGSYTMAMQRSEELVARVRSAMRSFEPDLVHCDSLFCAHVRPSRPATSAPWVLSLHNDEALLKERMAATAGEWLRRALYRREAAALGAVQSRALTEFDHVVAVSDAERARFEAARPGPAADLVTVPNGVEPLPEPEGPPRGPRPGAPLRLLFVGSLNYEPNAQGLEWFAQSVAPRVRERLDVEIQVVGPGRRGPELPGVSYLGRVDDVGVAYARAHAAVVPLRAGAGSRLKVVEALARGVPLVSTSIGVEGYDLADGRHALIADDPETLAERFALLDASLRGDRHLAGALVAAGYEFASAHFWPRIGEKMAAAYAGWAEAAASRAP